MSSTATSLMMPFDFEGKVIRFVGTAESPEWVASDVCAALGLANVTRALSGLKQDEKRDLKPTETPGNVPVSGQEIKAVNEPGLYRLIFKSKKEEAERFKRWVFHDVLPQIRKTGSFASRGVLAELERQSGELSAARHQIQLLADISSKQASLAASILASRGNQIRVEDRAFASVDGSQRLLIPDAGPIRTIQRTKNKRRARIGFSGAPANALSGGS